MLLLAVFSALSPASAETQDRPVASAEVNAATLQASAHIQLEWGQHLLAQGHHAAALAELEALVSHHDEPLFHWTLAQAYHAVGDEAGELAALQVFFTVAPPESVDALRARILELGGTLPMRTLRGVQRTQTALAASGHGEAVRPFWK
jgi:hypothetical protein